MQTKSEWKYWNMTNSYDKVFRWPCTVFLLVYYAAHVQACVKFTTLHGCDIIYLQPGEGNYCSQNAFLLPHLHTATHNQITLWPPDCEDQVSM